MVSGPSDCLSIERNSKSEANGILIIFIPLKLNCWGLFGLWRSGSGGSCPFGFVETAIDSDCLLWWRSETTGRFDWVCFFSFFGIGIEISSTSSGALSISLSLYSDLTWTWLDLVHELSSFAFCCSSVVLEKSEDESYFFFLGYSFFG